MKQSNNNSQSNKSGNFANSQKQKPSQESDFSKHNDPDSEDDDNEGHQ